MDMDEVFKQYCPMCEFDTWHEFSANPEYVLCLGCYFVHKNK